MSPLLARQLEFARKLATLEYWMLCEGLTWKVGRGLCCEACSKPTSLHRLSLAEDVLLFVDGVYQTDTESYRVIGEKWESIGGSWGGRWGDGNHLSLSWEGRR